MKEGGKIKNYCEVCCRETNHLILFVKKISGSFHYHQDDFYMVVECSGCDQVSYRTEFVDYEQMDFDHEEGEYFPTRTIRTYPKHLENHSIISGIYSLPIKIRKVYNEAIIAFANECYLLTAVAFRALIEAICLDKKIIGRDLAAKINRLVKDGLITKNESKRLHAVRFIGNDSVHEIVTPTESQLLMVLYIVEHLLNNIYVLDNDINGFLETSIDTFAEFEQLIESRLSKAKESDSFTLKNLLGKSVRRIQENLPLLEEELISKIKDGNYSKLKLIDIPKNPIDKKGELQYYEIGLDLED